jgi:hypothetical protein
VNRGVFGTAPLGSPCSPDLARAILREAVAHGFRDFDTAPFYGAGHAERLLGEFAAEGIRVSTKFGSPRPARLRFMAVRIMRATRPGDFVPPRALFASRNRELAVAGEGRVPAQLSTSMALLGSCARGFLFVHSPEGFPGASVVSGWASLSQSCGFVPGVSGPRAEDLGAWLASCPADACFQLHLDVLDSLSGPTLAALKRRTVWIHGLFSPGADARAISPAERQRAAKRWAAEIPTASFVVTSTQRDGVARAAAFVRSLQG